MLLGKKCSVEGCNKRAYAQGLCHEHYIQKLKDEPIDDSQRKIGFLRSLASVLLLLVWIALGVSFFLFCVHLYRSINYPQVLIAVGVLVFMGLLYLPIMKLLKCFDKSKIACIVTISLVVIIACLVILNPNGAFECVNGAMKSCAKWIASLFN